MRYAEVDGARLSVIGLGTWQFGSREWGYGDEYATTEAARIVHRAIELGINLIDTAEIYAFGRSERIVGAAIEGQRDKVFIATKLFPIAPIPPIVQQRATRSARRLGVDTIDLYQVHWPNPIAPIGPTMSGMRDLQQRKVIDRVGVSNFSLGRWQAAETALGSPVFSNQVEYSLAARGPSKELVPWAQANDRLVIAYSPLAQGFLSAKYDSSNPPSGVRATNPLFLPGTLADANELLSTLRDVAKAHDATPSQVALAWLVQQPNVVAIPGASSVEQLEANAAAADLELSVDELTQLDDASARFHRPSRMKAAPEILRRRFLRR